MSDYKLKLKALLHDPVHKILAFSNKKNIKIIHPDVDNKDIKWHEKVALDLYYYLFEENLEEDIIKQSDIIASGLSRILLSPEISDDKKKEFEEENSVFLENLNYINFTSGEKIDAGLPDNHDSIKEIFEKLGNLTFSTQDERARFYFLFLWRFLPEIFPWINTHPADSRVPNHSIYDHLVQTSAIVSCLEGGDFPAFLLFTIGPVQEFIAKAKKTSDLWAGSFLLSYLTFSAIEVIMKELGPDHVIFPNLNGQPFVDRWLYERLRDGDVNINVFTQWKTNWEKQIRNNEMEKPFDDVLTIANIPNRILAVVPSKKAKDLAETCKEAVFKKLNGLIDSLSKAEDKKDSIKKQVHSYFQIYYVVLPWIKDKKDKDKSDAQNVLDTYNELVSDKGIAEVIKFVKDHPYYKSTENTKNTDIGIAYSLLVELTERFLAARKNIRDFINISPQIEKKCKICGEYSVVAKDNEDDLCGVCYLKRKLPERIKNELNLSEQVRYPSTSEIPTVKYKLTIDKNLAKELIEKLRNIDASLVNNAISVPALKGNILYSIDGQFLVKDTYRKEYFKQEYGIEVDDEKLEAIKKFLKEKEISPPVYYAIVAMDGDEMGKWISGKKLPAVKELMHKNSLDALNNFWPDDAKGDLNNILNPTHPMSPSFHNEFSRRLSQFALNEVKEIVEGNHFGKLIYAGGDDVLAFLPCDEAVQCADDLQKAFKGKVGKNVTMSAGIVFVHHKYPLSLALQEVRSAEKLAKDKYGRNACCIKLLKNSGEKRVTGFKWPVGTDTSNYDFFKTIIELYGNDMLSPSFAYQFKEILQELGVKAKDNKNTDEKLKEVIKRELKRIYLHKEKKVNDDKTFFYRLIDTFDKWQYSYDGFANLFIIAKFLNEKSRE